MNPTGFVTGVVILIWIVVMIMIFHKIFGNFIKSLFQNKKPPRPDHYLMGMRLKDPVQIDGSTYEISQWDSYGIQLRKVPKKELTKAKFGIRREMSPDSKELERSILHYQELNGMMVGQRVSVNGNIYDFVEYGDGGRYTDGRDRIILRPWDRKSYSYMYI